MFVRDFDFELPETLIAQEPPAARGLSRLLLLSRLSGAVAHHAITSLPALLRSGDLLVVNNTRVFPARLLGRRVPSGGAVECLLVQRVEADRQDGRELWTALVHPGHKLKPGAQVLFDGPVSLRGEILDRQAFGRRTVCLWTDEEGGAVQDAIEQNGHVPLPPYIKRDDRPADRDRYQTVYAQTRGSIAAPTAGLHFTPELLGTLADAGVGRAEITLHVGYGTFQPIRVDRVEDHRLEGERYDVSVEAASAINRALDDKRRVIAVGTTTTRTLETLGRLHGGRVAAAAGVSDLFIYPGFQFQIINGLLTNFHLPQSSLLMLVSALAGREPTLDAYRQAVRAGYRFYSYGDAMLIT